MSSSMGSDLLGSGPYFSVYYVMTSYDQQHGLWYLGFWYIFERLFCVDKLRPAAWALISWVLIHISASSLWWKDTSSSMGSDLLCSDPYLSVYYVMISHVQQHGLWSLGFWYIFERLLCDDKLRPAAWALISWVLVHIWASIMWW